jgi:hypothetical protein
MALTKAQIKAAKAEEAAKVAEQKAADELRAKAIELSGGDAAAFDALAENDRQKFVDDAQAAIDAAEDASANVKFPAKIKLTCPFGYLDDAGVPHMWGPNQEVTDPAEIKDLIDHCAEHVVLE